MLLSRLKPFRRRVMAGRSARRSRDGIQWDNLNEKAHWSVAERYGRVAVVDETKYAKYLPKNLPKSLPDDQIAKRTPQESAFIKACHDSISNARRNACVLSRSLEGAKQDRRLRRIAEMRKTWPLAGGVKPES